MSPSLILVVTPWAKGFGGRRDEVFHFWPVEVRTELKRMPACTAIE